MPTSGAPPGVQVSISTPIAKAGTQLEVFVEVNGRLKSMPSVQGSWQSTPFTGNRLSPGTFVYRYTATGSEPETMHTIQVEAEGAGFSRNQVNVVFDFSPPDVAVVLRRPEPDPGVTSGTPVTFAFAGLSDEDELVATQIIVPGQTPIDAPAWSFDPNLREGVVPISPLDPSTESVHLRFTLQDAAGNQSIVDSLKLEADLQPPTGIFGLPGTTVPPVVYGNLISADAVAYRLTGDLVAEQLPPGDDDGFIPVRGGPIPLVVTPLQGDTAAVRTVRVELRDLLGNISPALEARTTVLPGLFSAPLLLLDDGRRAISPTASSPMQVRGFVAVGSAITSAQMVRRIDGESIDVGEVIDVDPNTGALSGAISPALMTDGEWQLEVIAASDDASTSAEESRSEKVRVDGVSPTGFTVVIAEGELTAASTVHVQLFADDASEIHEVRFWGDDLVSVVGDVAVVPDDGEFHPAGNRTYVMELAGEGLRVIHVDARDEAKNEVQGSAQVTIDPDAVDANPTLATAELGDTSVRPGTTLFVLGQAYPNDATLESAAFVFGDADGCSLATTGISVSEGRISGSSAVPAPPTGCDTQARLEVLVRRGDVVSMPQLSRSNGVHVDGLAPEPPVLSAQNIRDDGSVGDEVVVRVDASLSDATHVRFAGDGTIPGVPGGTWLPLDDGTLTIRLVMPSGTGARRIAAQTRDSAGNESDATTLEVQQVDRDSPEWLVRAQIVAHEVPISPDEPAWLDQESRVDITGAAGAGVGVQHLILQGGSYASFAEIQPDGSFPLLSASFRSPEFVTLWAVTDFGVERVDLSPPDALMELVEPYDAVQGALIRVLPPVPDEVQLATSDGTLAPEGDAYRFVPTDPARESWVVRARYRWPGWSSDSSATTGFIIYATPPTCQAGTTCETGLPCQEGVTVCDNGQPICQPAGLRPSTWQCRAPVGPCDAPEFCDGVVTTCPGDQMEPTTTVCRATIDGCDAKELCDGTTPFCPADQPEQFGTLCINGICDVEGTCHETGDSILLQLSWANAPATPVFSIETGPPASLDCWSTCPAEAGNNCGSACTSPVAAETPVAVTASVVETPSAPNYRQQAVCSFLLQDSTLVETEFSSFLRWRAPCQSVATESTTAAALSQGMTSVERVADVDSSFQWTIRLGPLPAPTADMDFLAVYVNDELAYFGAQSSADTPVDEPLALQIRAGDRVRLESARSANVDFSSETFRNVITDDATSQVVFEHWHHHLSL